MELFTELDYAFKLESTELSSLYLDLLEPKQCESTPKNKMTRKGAKGSKGKYHWNRVEQKRYVDFLL